jgi:predicted acetyltransferase
MTDFELRSLEAHDIDAYAACQASAFASRYPADKLESLAKELQLDRSLAVFDGAELVATTSSFATPMTLPGLVRSAVAAVTDVSVTPTHRRRGLLTAMMRRQLDDLRANSESIAVLYSSEGTIYGRYGYAPATFGAHYVVDKRLARLLNPGGLPAAAGTERPQGSVRLLEKAQAVEAYPLVHGAYVLTRVGELDRPEGEWAELLGDVTSAAMGNRFYACYEQAGRIDGYAVYRVGAIDPTDHWRRGVFVEELCTLSEVAYTSLWRYLLGIDLTEELRTSGRPIDEPVRYLFEDQRQLRVARWGDRTWARLVEVPRALALRRYDEEGALVIEVEDLFCPWNDGRFALHVDGDGVAVVERVGIAADLVLPVDVLASLYLGAVAFTAMAEVGRVVEQTEGAARRADRMFMSLRPPFCTTHF